MPPGWTGKLWAVKQGIDAAMALPEPPDYLLLTDADIVHASRFGAPPRRPRAGRRPRAHIADGETALREFRRARQHSGLHFLFSDALSVLLGEPAAAARWRPRPAAACWCARTRSRRPAASRRSARALIDDCALARALKAQGPIWLGLTDRVHSIRPYPAFADIRRMVARSAYAQLRYSPLLLAGTVVGMPLTYLAPPLFALFGGGPARLHRHRRLGHHGDRIHADIAVLSSVALVGHRAAAIALQYLIYHSRFSLSICARTGRKLEGAGASQRVGAGMTTAAEAAIGQGPPGREFSGGVAAYQPAPSRADPGVLRIRAHRRRHRRSCDAAARTRSSQSRPARSDPARQAQRRPGRRRVARRNSRRARCRRAMRRIC